MSFNICITLDYELNLGKKTGSVHKTLIYPTNKLISVLEKYNVKITLMVDSAYLYMLFKNKDKYESLKKDFDSIVSQLKNLSDKGHSIQLHLHPQWFYSTYDGVEWQLDFEHFKLSDMEPDFVSEMFQKSKLLLESIINKNVIAFRAGGFSIQTYNDHYNLLVSNNIKIDTSAVPGFVEKSKYHWYNYKSVPRKRYNFRFDITNLDEKGEVEEIPISTVIFNPVYYYFIRKRIEYRNSFKPFSEGQGILLNFPIYVRIWKLIIQLFKAKISLASIDGSASYILPLVLKKFRKISDDNCFVIIGHPKSFSTNSIYYTELFIKNTVGDFEFKTIDQL